MLRPKGLNQRIDAKIEPSISAEASEGGAVGVGVVVVEGGSGGGVDEVGVWLRSCLMKPP